MYHYLSKFLDLRNDKTTEKNFDLCLIIEINTEF